MVIHERYDALLALALVEFPKVVTGGSMVGGTALDGTLFRWDDAPHHQEIATFPHHLHNSSEVEVTESQLPVGSHSMALQYVLHFIEKRLDESRD